MFKVYNNTKIHVKNVITETLIIIICVRSKPVGGIIKKFNALILPPSWASVAIIVVVVPSFKILSNENTMQLLKVDDLFKVSGVSTEVNTSFFVYSLIAGMVWLPDVQYKILFV